MKGGIGIVLVMLGMMSIESDALWFPLTCLAIGSALVLWEVNSEKKNHTHDYTRNSDSDSRPYFLH